MTRTELTEQFRRLRREEARCPVESAAYALAALSGPDRTRAIDRFNAIYAKVRSVPTLLQEQKPSA